MYDQFDGLVINKPVAVIDKPIDLRSNIFDPAGGFYRDYYSLAEALQALSGSSPEHTAAIRSGHFPFFITPQGGGVTETYWFKDGTADADAVLMFGGAINEGNAF